MGVGSVVQVQTMLQVQDAQQRTAYQVVIRHVDCDPPARPREADTLTVSYA